MKKWIVCLAVCFAPLWARALFLGPTHLDVTDDGEFVAVNPPKEDPAFDNFWAYRIYPSKDQKKLRGKGVNVAVLDSGIGSNAEFNHKKAKLQDFTGSGSTADTDGHGTALAGVISAGGVRISGLAPDVTLFVFKIAQGGQMISPQAAANALNAVLQYNKENPQDKISVVNLSYGVQGGGFEPLSRAVRALYEQGVTLVAPSGNYAYPGVHYPANMPEVIAVSAMAADGSAYAHSSYGPQVEFIAPGDRVLVPSPDGNYTLMSGTSVAAGFVSAAAALAVEGYRNKHKKDPSPEEVRSALRSAAKKITAVHALKQGSGWIDVYALEKQF